MAAHARAAGVPAPDSAHQASAPGAQPADRVPARQGFSRIPPLAGDEDFGLDTGKDVTRIDALQAYTCVECGRCTEHCPAYNTGKVLNPKEIVLGLRRYLNEFGAGGEAPLLGPHISEEAAFQCTTCGACEFQRRSGALKDGLFRNVLAHQRRSTPGPDSFR